MTPEQEQSLKTHLKAIAQILYDESDPEAMKTLEGMELTLRRQIQTHCQPRTGEFFIQTLTGTQAGKPRSLKSTLGKLEITSRQAEKLAVLPHRQLSPPARELLPPVECQRLLRTSRTGCDVPDRHSYPC